MSKRMEFTGAYRVDFRSRSLEQLIEDIRGMRPHELDCREYTAKKQYALALIQIELSKRDPDELALTLIKEVLNG